jgi:anaphase-promoting complex subunit 2
MEVNTSLQESWRTATSDRRDNVAQSCVADLRSRGLQGVLCARVLADVECDYIEPAATLLQQLASAAQNPPDEKTAAAILRDAYSLLASGAARIRWLDNALSEEFPRLILQYALRCRAQFMTAVPKSLSSVLFDIFLPRFRSFGQTKSESAGETAESLSQFRTLCARLHALGFMSSIQEAISWILFEEIDEYVRSRASTQPCDRVLVVSRRWLERAAIPWLETVLSATEQTDLILLSDLGVPLSSKPVSQAGVPLDQWRKRLAFHLHETLAAIRIEQVLQLVLLYPRSGPALQDLKDCLLYTDKKALLIRSLLDQFSSQLLHAGTMTSTIIQQYINMIKALRCLDPQGVILESVSDPIRECLRRRPDTVRCIVSGMTGDGDLYEELERGQYKPSQSCDCLDPRNGPDDSAGRVGPSLSSSALHVSPPGDEDAVSDAGDDSEAEELDDAEFANWEPEPIDAPPRHGRWRSGGDAIATLVTIYGSSEQLVKEYRFLLADKLISVFDIDFDRETRILELLQQRFGVQAMHDCLVMLKDMRDSKEVLSTAKAEAPGVAQSLQNFEVTVMSKEFWPELEEEPAFKSPAELTSNMALFSSSFERAKKPRKLKWLEGLGMVAIHLTFDDGRVLDLTPTPLQAAIVMKFTRRPKWTVVELLNDLEMTDESALRRRLVLLANQDVIRATDSAALTYETIEKAEDMDSRGGVVDDESAAGSHRACDEGHPDENEAMAVYEPYIFAMLRNLGQLPLERIHNMLLMFVKTPAYDKTQAQLAVYLAKLVNDERLTIQAGMYKVRD